MKWHPIVNGDLSGIQQQETLLFTIFDERQNENYVTTGWILEDEGELVVRGVDPWGLNSNETKKVKAWMELPEPYKPNTNALNVTLTEEEQNEVIKAMEKAIMIIDEVEF